MRTPCTSSPRRPYRPVDTRLPAVSPMATEARLPGIYVVRLEGKNVRGTFELRVTGDWNFTVRSLDEPSASAQRFRGRWGLHEGILRANFLGPSQQAFELTFDLQGRRAIELGLGLSGTVTTPSGGTRPCRLTKTHEPNL